MSIINSSENIYIQQINISDKIQYNINSGPWIIIDRWPVTIINLSTNIISVSINTNLNINNNNYFICGSDNILFDGNNNNITIQAGTYNFWGFIKNGGGIINGYNDITIQNIIINSSKQISEYGGYLCWFDYGLGAVRNKIINCSVNQNSDLPLINIDNCGGICGSSIGTNGNISIINCNYKGDIIGISSGGICGPNAGLNGGNVNITNCFVNGNITGIDSGGICGENTGNNGIVNIDNCYILGNISGETSGGICGQATGIDNGLVTITRCYIIGNIANNNNNGGVGGICGMLTGKNGKVNIRNCYIIGNIDGYNCGGISGKFTGCDGGLVNISNCYTIGTISGINCGGICGSYAGKQFNNSIGTVNISNCYTSGTISGTNTSGIFGYLNNNTATSTNCYSANGNWSDNTANTFLINVPTSIYVNNPASIWTTIAVNTPYILSSFNDNIYIPNNDIKSFDFGQRITYNSNPGLIGKKHNLISINDLESPDNISISNNGVLTFYNMNPIISTTYIAKVFSYTDINYGYNFNTFTLNLIVNSNTCFSEGTPILTNKGIILIENIDPNIHTIQNKKIIAITKSFVSDGYLICFEKNSLGNNIPSNKTIVSDGHSVFDIKKNKMIKAYKFVEEYKNVYKIKNEKGILYNILLKKHDKITVNNLICETLHPRHDLAKMYNNNNQDEDNNSDIKDNNNKNENNLSSLLLLKKNY
jgi:hypothetical protein